MNSKITTLDHLKDIANRSKELTTNAISELAGLTSSGLTDVNSRVDSLYDYFQNALDDLVTEILSGDISANLRTDSGEVITTRDGEIIRMHRRISCSGTFKRCIK